MSKRKSNRLSDESPKERYDPEVPPDPAEWLALDEQVRIGLAESYRCAARVDLPNPAVRTAVRVVVENRITEEVEFAVRAMSRPMRQGLSRHEALHAVGAVFAEHYYEVARANDEVVATTFTTRYNAAVERLTAESWWRSDEEVNIGGDGRS